MALLEIENLHAEVGGKEILRGVLGGIFGGKR